MQTKPNPFKVDATDVPALVAALLFEITTLRAEVRALTEIAQGETTARFGRILMQKDDEVFEEAQDRLKEFGLDIQIVPEG